MPYFDTSIIILGVILTIVAVVLFYVFIVPENRRKRLNSFGKFLHDTANFNFLVLDKIIQFLYIFSTIGSIIYGVFLMISSFSYSYDALYILISGLLLIVLGPVVFRIVYEGIMMFILLVRNVIQIRKQLQYANNHNEDHDPTDLETIEIDKKLEADRIAKAQQLETKTEESGTPDDLKEYREMLETGAITEEEFQKKQEEVQSKRRWMGVCQSCGGSFEGRLIKKCSVCGKRKDY